ncbi:MAG: hypothetical protein AAFO80_08210 [Pseudomonadota bacterium]
MTVRSYLLGTAPLVFHFDDEIDLSRICPITGATLPPPPLRLPNVYAPDANLVPVAKWGGGSLEFFADRRRNREGGSDHG